MQRERKYSDPATDWVTDTGGMARRSIHGATSTKAMYLRRQQQQQRLQRERQPLHARLSLSALLCARGHTERLREREAVVQQRQQVNSFIRLLLPSRDWCYCRCCCCCCCARSDRFLTISPGAAWRVGLRQCHSSSRASLSLGVCVCL